MFLFPICKKCNLKAEKYNRAVGGNLLLYNILGQPNTFFET